MSKVSLRFVLRPMPFAARANRNSVDRFQHYVAPFLQTYLATIHDLQGECPVVRKPDVQAALDPELISMSCQAKSLMLD